MILIHKKNVYACSKLIDLFYFEYDNRLGFP